MSSETPRAQRLGPPPPRSHARWRPGGGGVVWVDRRIWMQQKLPRQQSWGAAVQGRGWRGGGGAGGGSAGRECPEEVLPSAGGFGEPGARKREGGDSDGGGCPLEGWRGGLGFGGSRARSREGLAEDDGLSDFDGGCTASGVVRLFSELLPPRSPGSGGRQAGRLLVVRAKG